MEHTLAHAALQAATQMAAAGQYHAASALLDTLEAPVRPLEALLLQAKILAQQGRYAEAIAPWQEVLAMAPDNSAARQGLHLAQRLRATESPSFFWRTNLYYGLGALAMLLFLLSLAYVVGCNVGYRNQQHRDATVSSQHTTQFAVYLEAQQKASQASQQHTMQAIAQLTQQQETLHVQTLAQFATIVPALADVQQAIIQTHTQTSTVLKTLQQRVAILNSGLEAEQHTRQADDQSRHAEAAHWQASLTTLTTLVNAQSKQLTAYLEAQRQAFQENQP